MNDNIMVAFSHKRETEEGTAITFNLKLNGEHLGEAYTTGAHKVELSTSCCQISEDVARQCREEVRIAYDESLKSFDIHIQF